MLDDHRCIFCAAGRHCMDGLEDHADSQPAQRRGFRDRTLRVFHGAGAGRAGAGAGNVRGQRADAAGGAAGARRIRRRRHQADGRRRPVPRVGRKCAGSGAGDICRWNMGIVSATI